MIGRSAAAAKMIFDETAKGEKGKGCTYQNVARPKGRERRGKVVVTTKKRRKDG